MCINTLRVNLFVQLVDRPTKLRGNDEPHILDLVVTNIPIVDSIAYYSPLGLSDHSVLLISCSLACTPSCSSSKF